MKFSGDCMSSVVLEFFFIRTLSISEASCSQRFTEAILYKW